MVLSLGVIAVAERLVYFATTIFTRRTLGADAIGLYSWNAALLGYFLLSVNPGLETVAKREVARDPAQAARYGSWLLTLQGVLGGVAFAATAIVAHASPKGSPAGALLLLQAISLLLVPLDFTWLVQARERMPAVAGLNVLLQLLQLPAFLLVLRRPADVTWLVLIPYPFRLALVAYTAWYCGRHGLVRWRDLRPRLRGAGTLLREALPIGLSQAAVMLYYNTDALILGLSHGDRAVGLYSTAYRLMLLPTFVYQATFPAFLPSLSRTASNRHQTRRVSADFFRLHAWLGLAAGALTWAAGRHILAALYGPGYAAEGELYEWLSLNLPLIFLNVGLLLPFSAWGLQRKQLKITCVAAAVNVGLNLLLVPRFGPPAAVATTLLAEAVVFVWAATLRSRRVHPIRWRRILTWPLVASAATGGCVRLAVDRWPAAWLPATMVGAIALAGCLAWAERRRLAGQLARWQSDRRARRATLSPSVLPDLATFLRQHAGRRYYFVPVVGNNGDRLIEMGSRTLLAEHGLVGVDRPGLADLIVINGGYAMSDLWPHGFDQCRRLSNRYPGVPLLVLPSSYWWDATDFPSLFARRTAPVYLYCREPRSAELLRPLRFPCPAAIGLDHDTALALARSPFVTRLRRGDRPGHVLVVPRFDAEQAGVSPTASRRRLPAWLRDALHPLAPVRDVAVLLLGPWPSRRQRTPSAPTDPAASPFARQALAHYRSDPTANTASPLVVADISDPERATFAEFCEAIVGADVVYTERLHVGIFAALLGKPTYLRPGNTHKIRGIYHHSLVDLPALSLFETAEDRAAVRDRVGSMRTRRRVGHRPGRFSDPVSMGSLPGR